MMCCHTQKAYSGAILLHGAPDICRRHVSVCERWCGDGVGGIDTSVMVILNEYMWAVI